MCGRYVNIASTGDLTDEFDVEESLDEDLPPSWNIAPTDPVRVVMRRRMPGAEATAEPVTQLRTVRWGLVPNWSKSASGGAKMINARIETVTAKPAFKSAAARRRCLVPALGYYEWQRDGGRKIPQFLYAPGGGDIAMAGLYELWRDQSRDEHDPSRWLWTCTIVTQPATDVLGHIHDRCPVLVPPELRAAWLDCRSEDPAAAQQLLDAMPEPHLQPRVVSTAVGNVRNNGPELIEPAEPGPQPAQQLPYP